MANSERDSLMTESPSADIGGMKRNGLSTATILGYYYSWLTIQHVVFFPTTQRMYEGVVFPRHNIYI